MSQFLRLSDYRRKSAFVHFDRSELAMLLDLYARRVAAGEWRDYAIDNGDGRAVFAIFRRSQERPLFSIVKLGGGAYLVTSGEQRLCRGNSLAEALKVFDRTPRLVT